jgi:Response regulator of the LytR/AlgR family
MKKKILVIEDEKTVNRNITELLSEEGYAVFSSEDGRTGINTAKEILPDMIICDIMMPGKDGYAVLNELSKNAGTKNIPFIFLTAKVENEDLRKGMQLGADDYIFKPFKSKDLLKAIKARFARFKNLTKEPAGIDESDYEIKYSAEDKLFVKANGEPQLIKINEILFIAAESQYTMLKTADNKTLLLRKSVAEWEKLLPAKNFLRIHRSTIINLEYITKIEKYYNSSFVVFMKNTKEPFIISKRYSALLRKNLI